ncbi:hypothetical protein DCC81_12050 [Chitinophaga parva]|uniref:Uncharacterized protein n=1 Tax=Chitinophaga parva TaxID=2169414 RepID=A0A2T7BFH9_9BACT|nr:hypothetical protein [Chitinophaga parva]PUZ25039.1 hypothetical protein DCC81_12050 [Chitinophaga parva]
MSNEQQSCPGAYYQPLFNLMEQEHGLILLESQMIDIIRVVESMKSKPGNNEQQKPITAEEFLKQHHGTYLPYDDIPHIMRQYADQQTAQLRQENEQLKRWKQEQIQLFHPLFDWVDENIPVELGRSRVTALCEMKAENERLQQELQQVKAQLDECSHFLRQCVEYFDGDMLENFKDAAEKFLSSITK